MSGVVVRRAGPADAEALRDLEQAANEVALAAVFAGHRFPREEVLAHWRVTLAEPGVVVEVVDAADGGLAAFAARDATTLRHLAVHPHGWGAGLGGRLTRRAATAITAGGTTPLLWCLVLNERALGFYDHLGWRATGHERPAPWPPHPVERQLALMAGADASRSTGDE